MRYAIPILALVLFWPAAAAPRKAKWWERVVAPLRPRVYDIRAGARFAPALPPQPGGDATLVRLGYGNGRFDHQWLELETSEGPVAVGFGPATFRFIDAGQVTIRDADGKGHWLSGLSVFPFLTLPQVAHDYAGKAGEGFAVRKPIRISREQADAIVRDLRSSRAIVPYIPLFYDCHTFACRVEAKAAGKSTLPCYLPFRNP
jgi:hypothetical protein